MLNLWYYGTHMMSLRYSDDIIASSVYSYGMFMVFSWYYRAIIVLLRYVQGIVVVLWYYRSIMVFSSHRIGRWLGPEEERALEDSAKPYVYCYIEDKKPCHG